jgi:hypothetical protein
LDVTTIVNSMVSVLQLIDPSRVAVAPLLELHLPSRWLVELGGETVNEPVMSLSLPSLLWVGGQQPQPGVIELASDVALLRSKVISAFLISFGLSTTWGTERLGSSSMPGNEQANVAPMSARIARNQRVYIFTSKNV